eukprot:CAMPEP_0171329966 /NCGR_PEP_ID=MMETSP0878-20121228/1679_1 /TAXON_ID=67004 /ORGANISM="Thalassiosira weissflogii, Strain CCMP1336" /LENGTH=106 /DNA_ID=CAMNT_0011830143 /DNA_START=378 /DNA_END=698 /DNA_ORIENTATION=+
MVADSNSFNSTWTSFGLLIYLVSNLLAASWCCHGHVENYARDILHYQKPTTTKKPRGQSPRDGDVAGMPWNDAGGWLIPHCDTEWPTPQPVGVVVRMPCTTGPIVP